MSGPQRVTDWSAVARALASSGCDLTEYGQFLASAPRRSVCSWCEAEGFTTVLREGVEPVSHGCCEKHAQQMLKEAGLA